MKRVGTDVGCEKLCGDIALLEALVYTLYDIAPFSDYTYLHHINLQRPAPFDSLYMWCKPRICRLHNLQFDPIFGGLDGTSMEAPRFGFTEPQTIES